MQNGEGIASTTIYDVEEEEKEEEELEAVEIRYCIFFDGTLNNRDNIKTRLIVSDDDDLRADEIDAKLKLNLDNMSQEDIQQATDTYKEHGATDPADDNSYEGFFTNIEKMEKYVEDHPKYKVSLTSYVQGMGSTQDEGDSTLGFAVAKGDSGIPARVDEALDEMVDKIKDAVKTDQKITKVAIDVFGFSRGAASARYFIHQVMRGKDGDDSLRKRIEKVERKISKGGKSVEIVFAGLYDTVSTYGLLVAFGEWGADNVDYLKLKSVRHAKKTFQLASADEHRKYFSLTNIQSAGYKGKQIFLPGVHSDVGGGYRDASDENAYLFRGTRTQAEQDMQNLINLGWYKESDFTLTDVTYDDPEEGETYLYTKLTAHRKQLRNAYSRIPLHLMAEAARGEEVELKINGMLERDEDIPASLASVKKEIDAYVEKQTANSSRAEDWLNHPASWVKELRYHYTHFSARIKLGHTPRLEGVNRVRHIYNG